MKITLMILFLLGGLAMTSATAQSCAPCPPACCAVACAPAGKSSAGVDQNQAVQNALVSFSPEAMPAECQGKKMTKKEMKECQVACQPVNQAGCQPASVATPASKTHAAPTPVSASLTPAAPAKSIKQ